jgi:hypothetical protein
LSDPGGTLGCMTRTAKLDEDALEQRLGRQRLVISRDQATACGMTPERVCFEGAVQFALVPRAVANAARELASFRDTRAVVADAVQQGRCRIDLLGEELRRGPARRSAWLRRALNEVTGGARSATEGISVT